MDEENRVIRVLRAQAWERAKGELQAMLNTFFPHATHPTESRHGQFEELDKLVDEFVEKVEGDGLEE